MRVFEQAMRADFVVSSSHIGAGALEMPVDDALAATLPAVDGVASVIGVRLANWQHEGGPVVLDAFDPDYFRNPAYGAWPLHGARLTEAWDAVADGRAVVVSSNFAQNIGVAVGDIDHAVDTPTAPLPLLVAGITTDFASPRGTIEMSRALVHALLERPAASPASSCRPPGQRADQAVRGPHCSGAWRPRGGAWRVISSGELVAYWATRSAARSRRSMCSPAVILAVVLFGIADNLSASVAERTRELGTLRAVGVSQGQLRRMVVREALVIAPLGLRWPSSKDWRSPTIWIQTTIPYLLGWLIDLRLPVEVLLFVCIATLACCAVAAVIPGRRAARLQPAMALRCE